MTEDSADKEEIKDANPNLVSSSANDMILGWGKDIYITGKDGKKRFVGILESGILVCERLLGRKFHMFDGWGISRQLIHELVQVHAKRIIFKIVKKHKDFKELQYTLETAPINWKNRGIPYFNQFLQEDQLILPETSFDRRIEPSLKVVR